jgi:hypothetical protein
MKHYAKSFYYRARLPYKRRSDILYIIVVYDLTEDGSRLDEKILNTAVYKYLISKLLLGSNSNPAAISTISAIV